MRRWLTIAALLAATTTAHADWQGTRWGMTLEEVRLARPDINLRSEDEAKVKEEKFWGRPDAYIDLRTPSFEGRADLYFLNGRLKGVSIDVDETFPGFLLERGLVIQYGQPDLDQRLRDLDMRTMLWRSEQTNDLVMLNEIASVTTRSKYSISYQPIPTAAETGF